MKTILKHEYFNDWFESLKDKQLKLRIQVRIDRAQIGHYGDCKSVGEGVMELRLSFGAGYRIYFIERGSTVIVLLAGGDKSTQAIDIKKAIYLAKQLDWGE